MANYTSQVVGFGQFNDPEQERINQQRQMAALLRQQSSEPLETQVVSGRVVPISWTQGLAKLLQGYAGRKDEELASEAQSALNEKRAQESSDTLGEFQKLYQGAPEQKIQSLAPTIGNDPNAPQEKVIPAVAGNPAAAYARLLRSNNPMLAQMGVQGMAAIPNMEAQKQAREEGRQFQREQLEAQLAARKEAQAAQFQNQREMANIAASLRQPQAPVQVLDPRTGKPIYVSPGTAYGMQPFNAATEQKQISKQEGEESVASSLAGLRDAYDRLEKGGGITSTGKNPISNAAAFISSSPVGQLAGKMVGSANQSARNDIAMQRPALLAALMRATGMSAKQMDSNAELKLWLATATDPTLDVEANRRALDNIERKYLRGNAGMPKSGGVKFLGFE